MADDRPAPDLYETDFYAWTQAQAQALRAPGAGGSNVIEWARVAEELADVGKAERNAVRSSVRNIIVHLMLLESARGTQPRAHWRTEILNVRAEAEVHISPSIRRLARMELDKLHMKAARIAASKLSEHEPDALLRAGLRWSLAELLGERDDPLERLQP